MELIIIRHARPRRHEVSVGETADPELAEVGLEQAGRTAEFLASEGIDHVVSSTMRRARQTAHPLAASIGVDVETMDELRESDHRSHVYVPVAYNSCDVDTLLQIEELSREAADELVAGRPYASTDAFAAALGKHVPAGVVEQRRGWLSAD